MATKKKRKARPQALNLFSLIGLVVVLSGQGLLYTSLQDESAVPPALWISVLGAVIFVLGWFTRHGNRRLASLVIQPKTLWLVAGLVFSLLTAFMMVLFQRAGRQNYIPVLAFWSFAMVCVLAALAPRLPSRIKINAWVRAHRHELAAVAAITAIAFALRFYGLGAIPRVVNGDEGRVGLNALQTQYRLLANPFALWENFGALYLQSISLALSIFGVSPFSLRLMAAIGGTLAIPALYLLGRQVAGKRIGMIAAILLAFSHTHIHFSRTIAVAYVQGTWLIPLEFFFFLRGLTLRRSWMMAVSGILLAVHFSVYLDSQIALLALTAFALVGCALMWPWMRGRVGELAAFFGSFAIFIIPELVFILRGPNLFFDRLNSLGSFQTGWVSQQMAQTGNSMVEILGGRVLHAFLSLIFYPAFDFYGSPLPMLSLVSGSLFMLGLLLALVWTRRPEFLILNAYFWTGTFAVGLFAIPPSADSYRMLIVLPAAFILAAIGLDQALTTLRLNWSHMRLAYVGAAGLLVASLAVFNIWAYFGQFAGQCLYGRDSTPARFASYLGNYLASLEPHVTGVLLSDEVFFYGSHSSVKFLSNGHPVVNVPDPVDTVTAERFEAVIATPGRIEELRAWAEENPGGDLVYQYDCGTPILLAYEFR